MKPIVAEEKKSIRHVDLIGNRGKNYILSTLKKTDGRPVDHVYELQKTAGLQFPSERVLPFLDLLQVPRAVVYQYLFEASKDKLIKLIQSLPKTKLIQLLTETIHYLSLAELKAVPISILKRLGPEVPQDYLRNIGKRCSLDFILNDLPAEVVKLAIALYATTCMHTYIQLCICYTTLVLRILCYMHL